MYGCVDTHFVKLNWSERMCLCSPTIATKGIDAFVLERVELVLNWWRLVIEGKLWNIHASFACGSMVSCRMMVVGCTNHGHMNRLLHVLI